MHSGDEHILLLQEQLSILNNTLYIFDYHLGDTEVLLPK